VEGGGWLVGRREELTCFDMEESRRVLIALPWGNGGSESNRTFFRWGGGSREKRKISAQHQCNVAISESWEEEGGYGNIGHKDQLRRVGTPY